MPLSRPHLVVDARCIRGGAPTGVGTSTLRHLTGLERLLRDGECSWKVSAIRLLTAGDKTALSPFWSELNHLHIIDTDADPEDHPGADFWQQRRLPDLLNRVGADVIYSPAFVAPQGKCPAARVTMIHDDLVWSEPGSYPLKFRLWLRMMATRSARASDRIVFPTKDAQDRCLPRLGVAENRAAVLHHGIDSNIFFPPTRRDDQNARTVLYIASALPRKDHKTLVQAMSGIENVKLVCVGLGNGAERLLGELRTLAPELEIEAMGDLTDTQLAAQLRTATAYAHTSHAEGFGMPVLEAMACGTPMVLSDISVLREVAGDNARFVEVGNVPAWKAALERVLNSNQESNSDQTKAYERASKMTIESTARKLLTTCEEAIEARIQ